MWLYLTSQELVIESNREVTLAYIICVCIFLSRVFLLDFTIDFPSFPGGFALEHI